MDLSSLHGLLPKFVDEFVLENPITLIVFTLVLGVLLGVVFFYAAQLVGQKPPPVILKSNKLPPDEEDAACDEVFRKLRGGFNAGTIGSLRRSVGIVQGQRHLQDPDNEDCYIPAVLTEEQKFQFDVDGNCINKVTELSSDDDSDLERISEEDSEEDEMPQKTTNEKEKKVLNTDQVELGEQQMKDCDLLGKIGELHGKLKTAEIRAKTKLLEKEMTKQQREEEARMRAHQLESIFNLMVQDQDKFGVANKEDLNEQLKLYSL